MKKEKVKFLKLGLLTLAALCLLYPVIANYRVIHHNTSVIADYMQVSESDRQLELEKMRQINERINDTNFYSDELDPFTKNISSDQRAMHVVGVLTIPQIDEELAIYEQTNTKTLAKGVALLKGTHYPTGGLSRMSVITGHRGTSEASMLKNVHLLKNGDVFWIDNGVNKLYYQVYKKIIVEPDDTQELSILPGQDTVVLLTCETPDITKGINTHRLLVYAKRTLTPEKKRMIIQVADSRSQFKIMAAVSIGILVVVLVLSIIYIVRRTCIK